MKNKISNIFAKVALVAGLLVAFAGTAFAYSVTFTYSDYNGQGTSSTGSSYTMTKSDVSITNTKFYGNTSYAQFYAGGTTTITPSSGVTITGITLTASATSYNGYQSSGTITATAGSVSGSTSSVTVTWSGSATTAFSITNNKQIRWTSIVVTYTKSGGSNDACATPTFDPAAGTYNVAQNVSISTTTDDATIYYTTNGETPTTSSTQYSGTIEVTETQTIMAIAVKEGMENSEVASATYTINLPYSGPGYVRINSLDNLTDGAKVIIAARYNSTAKAYYAMTAATTGKPTGVSFESTSSNNGESLPSSILNSESTYYWTVGKTTNEYTFTNNSDQVLGYSSSTNFATGGNNTEWVISKATSGNDAMVAGYDGFYFTNKNNSGRGIALNSNFNYGPYSTGNNNSSDYNFYLDLFVEGATVEVVPTISADDVNLAYDATAGSITYTLANPVDGGSLSAVSDNGWLTVGTITNSTVNITCAANESTTARTATVTLSYKKNDNTLATKEVTVTQAAAPSPSITADNVNLAYNATAGSITYTLANPVDGGSLSAVSDNGWLTVGTITNSTVNITCAANESTTARTATVTLSYKKNDNTLATKEVTVTQAAAPVIYSTIPSLFASATSTETSVNVTFNNWVVSGVSTNGKNIFVTDNSGNGFVIYYTSNMSSTYSVGKILSGTGVSCSLKLYNGFAELVNVNASDLTITAGGTIAVADIEMANLAGVNTGALVSYQGLTCSINNSKYYLSDGTTTLQVFNSLYNFDALEAGKTYNITGIYQQYNNTKEILPRNSADIEEYVNTEPTITVTPASITPTAAETVGSATITYANLEIADESDFDIQFYDSNNQEIEYPDWIVATVEEDSGNYLVSYTIGANEGNARSTYFKVFVLDDDYVYSNLVTVNQAAPTPDYASLPFGYDGNGTGSLPTGLTQVGLGTKTYSSSPKIGFDDTDDCLVLKINEAPGTLSFKIKGNSFSGGTFKVQTSINGVDYTDLAEYTDLGATQTEEFTNLASKVRYIKWVYTNKVSGNVALGDISVEQFNPTAPTITLSATPSGGRYWTTYFNSDARYSLPAGAQAFTMNASKQLFLLGADGSVIPANVAVIIIADSPEITLTKSDDTSSITINGGANILQGANSNVAKSGISGTPYVLGIVNNTLGFYQFSGASIPAMKAYYVVE